MDDIERAKVIRRTYVNGDKLSKANISNVTEEYVPRSNYNKLKEIDPVYVDGKVSTSATLEKLSSKSHTAAVVLGALVPASHGLYENSNEAIRLGAFVPKLMCAFKEAYGIKYNEWDREDTRIKYALGLQLEDILNVKKGVEFPHPNTEDLFNRLVFSGWQLKFHPKHEAVAEFNELWGISTYPTKELGFFSAAPYILLQGWQAAKDKRIKDRMILNPYDWDDLPQYVRTSKILSSKPNLERQLGVDLPEI